MKLNNGIFVPFSYKKEEKKEFIYRFEVYEQIITDEIYQAIVKEEKLNHNWKKEGF